MTETCSTCKFFMHSEGAPMGVCRRYPPLPIVIGMRERSVLQRGPGPNVEPVIGSFYPEMFPVSVCGEHKPLVTLS